MGEYLINAQGDVVAGVRTPSPISHLHEQMPEVYDQFVEIATRLENYFRDMHIWSSPLRTATCIAADP